ncbi:MAG: Nin1 binding protein [Stictis urceolatum]|nr:Nin1 binding protein [Stictis urceolata]
MSKAKPIHSVVLDAGPLLLNQPSVSTLLARSEHIFTTPSVLAEIKDETARNRLETTVRPFLTIRSPNPSSLKAVSDFARKTGDLAVLSRTDLQIFALAYELECERNHGDWRLRSTPGQKRLNGSPPHLDKASEGKAPPKDQTSRKNDSSPTDDARQQPNEEGSDDSKMVSESSKDEVTRAPPRNYVEATGNSTISQTLSTLALEPGVEGEDEISEPSHRGSSQPAPQKTESAEASSESDSDGWITPSNLIRRQRDDDKTAEQDNAPQKILQVATLTTDFALQNSLLLMNLNLLSPSLARISYLKSHILRCHACFATTKEMTRQFCHRCGGPTLTRVSCSTTSKGGFKLHLKNNMQWNTRGDRYSIPKPVHGTSNGKMGKSGKGQGGKGGWGKELLLAEDQKEYVRAITSQQRRKEKDLMDEDYLPRILTGERGGAGKIRVGAGRNVNSRKR